MGYAVGRAILMRVTILVTRAATLIKQRRIVSNWASRQNEDPVEPSACHPMPPVSSEVPNTTAFTDKERPAEEPTTQRMLS
jgi:hypothetical protein